jgi:hypothetical protein
MKVRNSVLVYSYSSGAAVTLLKKWIEDLDFIEKFNAKTLARTGLAQPILKLVLVSSVF